MSWDVVGSLGKAVGWVHDKADEAVDTAGHAVDGAVHAAEHGVDDARKAIVDFGDHHGGVVGQFVAHNLSDSIGLVEGAGLAVYDAGSGLATMARGLGRLTDPVEWAMHPDRNIARAQTAGNALTAMAKLGSPVEWALHTKENATTAKALWNGVTAGYQDAAKSGDWSKFAGRAVVDVGSFFIGAGEANAAVKGAEGANAAVHAAEGLNATTHAAEGLNGATHAAEGLNGAAHGGEALADASHGATAASKLTVQSATTGRNTVKWTVDAEGHTIKAEANLKEVFAKAPRSSTERNAQAASGAAGKADDVGGHIIGHRFVKDQGPVNMFPQNVQFNNSAYKKLENEWADWVGKGKEVDVQVSLSGGTPTRPDRVNVRYVVTDPATGDVVFTRAKPFKNEAGQTFDRVQAKDMLP
jgi:hypothetical protein